MSTFREGLRGTSRPHVGMDRPARAQLRAEEPVGQIRVTQGFVIILFALIAFELVDALPKSLFRFRRSLDREP